jgi:hypothetical protein
MRGMGVGRKLKRHIPKKLKRSEILSVTDLKK